MPTYRSAWPPKDLFVVALLGFVSFSLGGFMVVSRPLGVVLRISEKGQVGDRPMALGEQYGMGALLLTVGAAMFVLLSLNLFPRVDWDPPRVVAYGWRNQVFYSGTTADLSRISWLTREWGGKWFRVEGKEGAFLFPERWADSAQLVERIAEAVEANVARDPARPAPR